MERTVRTTSVAAVLVAGAMITMTAGVAYLVTGGSARAESEEEADGPPAIAVAATVPEEPPAAAPVARSEQSSPPDRDGDGLSDFAETHKYLTDPAKADSDGDGRPDGDADERREYTYSVRAVIRVMRPVAPDFLNDDYQDARVLRETDTFVEFEFVLYPHSTAGSVIASDSSGDRDASVRRYLRPGTTTNFDQAMKASIRTEVAAAGIDLQALSPADTVRKVSAWLLGAGEQRDMFCTFFTDFDGGQPRVLPGTEEAFDANKGDSSWTVKEQFAHELFGREMFANKSYGTCTSAAVYLTTGLRALDVPTRMVLCIPIADASDPAQVKMVENGLGEQDVRAAVLRGLKPGSTSFTSHTFNEVHLGGRWLRLNYSNLGEGILNPRYMGLFVHVHTFSDLSEAGLAPTWGRRYAERRRTESFPHSNPYRTLLVDDLLGPYAKSGRGGAPSGATSEHRALTISKAYWGDSAERPSFISRERIAPRLERGGLFLIHVDEWFPEQSYAQLKQFMQRAGRDIVLRAEGHADVGARLNHWYHTAPNVNGREFEVAIDAAQFGRMVPGVAYALHPENQTEYRWRVADGVRLTRPE